MLIGLKYQFVIDKWYGHSIINIIKLIYFVLWLVSLCVCVVWKSDNGGADMWYRHINNQSKNRGGQKCEHIKNQKHEKKNNSHCAVAHQTSDKYYV